MTLFRFHWIIVLALTGCSSSESGTSSPDGGASIDGGDATHLHIEGNDGKVNATADFTGVATGESQNGVYCEYWNQIGGIPPNLEVAAHDGALKDILFKWWDMRLDAGESRMESFTSTKSTLQVGVTLSDSGFSYSDPAPTPGTPCTTTLTDFTSTHIAGSLTCTDLPGEGSSKVSLSMTFDCPLKYHPAS